MPLSAQPEPFMKVLPEMLPLLEDHWRELALGQSTCPLAPRWRVYEALAELGVLQLVTLRDGPKLVGYWWGMVDSDLHYRHNIMARTDIFRVLPEVRGRFGGVRLFRAVIRHLKSQGVYRLYVGSKLHKDSSRLFKALGFSAVEVTHSISI